MKSLVLFAAVISALSVNATPVLSGVAVEHDADSRIVRADYTLNVSGIVTFDVCTNGVSIGGRHLRSVGGDVNRVVGPGEHTIFWRCDDSLKVDLDACDIVLTSWRKTSPPDWMALDLITWKVQYYATPDTLPEGIESDLYKTNVLLMRRVPAGGATFLEGSPVTEWYRTAAQETQRQVTFEKDFYIGVYEFTYQQFARIGWKYSWSDHGAFNYSGRDENRSICPINNISFQYLRGATFGIQWPDEEGVDDDSVLGYLRKKSGIDFDLPTDAQWEFACRAGSTGPHYNSTSTGASWDTAGKIAWLYYPEINRRTAPQEVGQKEPNAYGLYDMIGNVWELVRGRPYASTKPSDPVTDPKGPSKDESNGSVRRRGAAYNSADPAYIRSASTTGILNGVTGSDIATGFRVVCSAEAK